MAVAEHKEKKKKKPPRDIKNKRLYYLEEEPYKYACHKAWRPQVYEFRPEILFYDVNAYDKFVPAMEIRRPDEHFHFTRYLQSFETDISDLFYKWIANAADRTFVGTHNLAYCDKGESPSANAQWWREMRPDKIVWPIRKAYSVSQLDIKVAADRRQYIPEFFTQQRDWADTTYPAFIAPEDFINAQMFTWRMNNGFKTFQPQCKVGFVDVRLVKGATYGPVKFFVYLTGKGCFRGMPARKFSKKLKKLIRKKGESCLRVPQEDYVGAAIYFDTSARDGQQYIPVYILRHKLNNCDDIFLYNMELGTIIRCHKSRREWRLRHLPYELEKFIYPIAIPCRMYQHKMSPQSWKDFIAEVKRTRKMYVTGVFPRYLQVGRVKPAPEKNLEHFFCTDIHCLGACVKDQEDLTELCTFDLYKKTRKKSLSSADISDVEL